MGRYSGSRRGAMGAPNYVYINAATQRWNRISSGSKQRGVYNNGQVIDTGYLNVVPFQGGSGNATSMNTQWYYPANTGATTPQFLYNYKSGEQVRMDTMANWVASNPSDNPYGSAMGDTYFSVGFRSNNTNRGDAVIYNLSTKVLTKMSTTAGQPITGLGSNSYFGWAVAINNSYAVFGAVGISTNRGNAYLYNIGTGAWTDLSTTAGQPITALAANSLFGQAVAIWGDYVLIGAPGVSANNGNAFLYQISTGTWTNLGASSGVPPIIANKQWGNRVALNSTYAFVNEQSGNQGMTFMYNLSTGAWYNTGYLSGWTSAGTPYTLYANDEMYTIGGTITYNVNSGLFTNYGSGNYNVGSAPVGFTQVLGLTGYGTCVNYANAASNWIQMGASNYTPPFGTADSYIIDTLSGPTKTFMVTTTGNSTFTVPSDFNRLISLNGIGCGGNGASTTGGGGGGGGAFAQTVSASLTAGQSVYYQIGAGGSNLDTWVNTVANYAPTVATNGLVAKAGLTATTATGGTGGTTAASIGNFTRQGGNGGNNYGGGGGAGGQLNAGGNGGAGSTSATTGGGGGGGAGNNSGGGGNSSGTTGGAGGNKTNAIAATGATASVAAGPAPVWGAGCGGAGGFGTVNRTGTAGSTGADWFYNGVGYGSGGGGGGSNAAVAASAANYGGGGGGGSTGGSGAQGLIVLVYTI